MCKPHINLRLHIPSICSLGGVASEVNKRVRRTTDSNRHMREQFASPPDLCYEPQPYEQHSVTNFDHTQTLQNCVVGGPQVRDHRQRVENLYDC